jgi:hypothetical protein
MFIPISLHPRRKGSNEDATTTYFLEVVIEVAGTEREKFSRLGQQFLYNFEQVGFTPVVSAWRTDTGPVFAVNYWNLGTDANTLLNAEFVLPEIPGFTEFNAMLQSESKNLAVSVAREERVAVPVKLPRDRYRYLRVVSRVAVPLLPEFVARVEGNMRSFTERPKGVGSKWYVGDTYLMITGAEGMVSQIWIIPVEDVPLIPRRLAQAKWLEREVTPAPPDFQVLRATHCDPLLEASTGDEV